jgi:hypothetical protein
MSRFYLAGRFSKRFELQGVRADLQRLSHICTSRWIDVETEDEAELRERALMDIEDIRLADTLIAFHDPPRTPPSRGGHFFEEGFAHALGRRVILIGARCHVFHHLIDFDFFESWPEALSVLRDPLNMGAR